jgi:hypothetical protein
MAFESAAMAMTRRAKRKPAAQQDQAEPALLKAGDLPPPAPVGTALERPKIVFWETLVRQFPDLKRSEVLVVNAFTQAPCATHDQLAELCGLSRQKVCEIVNSERWGALLRSYMVARGDRTTGNALLVLEKWTEYLLQRQAKGHQPDNDDRPLLETVLKRGGALAPDVAVNVNTSAGGSAVVLIGAELDATLSRLREMALQSQAKPAVSCDTVPAQVSNQLAGGGK